jgi:hypothetical protein
MSDNDRKEHQYQENVINNVSEEEIIIEKNDDIDIDEKIEEIHDELELEVSLEEESSVEEVIEEVVEENIKDCTIDKNYYVGTEFEDSYPVEKLDDAIKESNENTKINGVVHNVYNSTGKIVFTSKKKLTLLSNKKRKVNKNADWYFK